MPILFHISLHSKSMKSNTNSEISLAFSALLMLLVPFQTVAVGNISLPGCPDKCGDIDVPFPFGYGPNCAFDGQFNLSCIPINGQPTPFWLGKRVLGIDLGSSGRTGQIRVGNNASYICYDHNTNRSVEDEGDNWLDLTGRQYMINKDKNKFTVIGCDALAFIAFSKFSTKIMQGGCIVLGCYEQNSSNSGCSGLGCCQTSIPTEAKYYDIWFEKDYVTMLLNKTYNFSWCSYAMITDDDEFVFKNIDYTNHKLYKQEIPLVLDWAIRESEKCDEALKNYHSSGDLDPTYACKSIHSECVDSTNTLGYFCKCSEGYEGNPYLVGGCRDIDECVKNGSCSKGTCHNTDGSYYCSCPLLMRLKANAPHECHLHMPSFIGAIIALGFGTGFTILLLCIAIARHIRLFEKRRQEKVRQKFFIQNRGLLLQQLLDSHEDTAQKMRIFRFDELKKATNKFDVALIIGQGGHGEVYKGILSDQRVVAIKRSKIVDQTEIDQFINEVAILSQVNHRNVVKLFGCCLETEVPLLVYEFISNGTLFNHLHEGEQCSLTWKQRLRIALEAAGAISYLHSSASISIFHRDIKSSNILLDDYLTTKVSDFGASRSVQIDQTGITTAIQGTHGYLDPEYYYTGRLTEKSDVYSFGVIIAELLTRQKPLLSSGLFEGGSLISYFLSAMNENRLFEVLDPQIVTEHNKIELETVAKLSQMCLRMKGEDRPTMKEVELQLEVLWRSYKQQKHGGMSESLDERQLSLSDNAAEIDIINQYSFEDQLPSSSNFSQQWNSLK